MAGMQISGDGVPSSLAGMSMNQLYDIMSQMKASIEQNEQQARKILIQNPILSKALFQAQIMLGMVQPPQASPEIPSTVSQVPNPQPPPASNQKPKIQPTSSIPGQTSPNQIRNQQPDQSSGQNLNQTMLSKNPHPHPTLPSPLLQPAFSSPLRPLQQPKALLKAQSTQMSLPLPSSRVPNRTNLPSELPNLTQLPQHDVSQPTSLHQPYLSSLPPQSQQSIQSSGNQYSPFQQPLQTPLPPQPGGPKPGFPHQGHGQMAPNMGFQNPGGPSMHPPRHMFHSGRKPLAGMRPAFPPGQLPHIPNQPFPPSLYQPHSEMDYSHSGNSMQMERGGPNRTPGVQENPMGLLQRSLSFTGQLTTELGKTLLHQVMSLTAEQINSMPPEHRNQILQLQQMLRQ